MKKKFASPSQPTLFQKIQAGLDQSMPQPKHLIVRARAGTGKTTTLIEGLKKLKGLPSTLTPSAQQKAVWDSICLSDQARTVCFVAFNKGIATELQNRVPEGCEAMTMHSMGYRAVRNAFSNLGSPNSYRVQDIISELLERDIRELRKGKPEVIKATEQLVGLCKQNLTDPTPEALVELASYYEVELNGSLEEVIDLVPRVLTRCQDVTKDNSLDFNDMIWLPVVLNLPLLRYDLLLVDEAQDLNRCQQQLALRAGKRLILCGDDKQAIYGFAGADAQSLTRMEETLSASPQGCHVLPLTVTRRCAKLIVEEAKKLVPDFEAFETNGAGVIRHFSMDKYRKYVYNGDMVLCRVNAPLVSQCFRFIREGRKANIQGRDIGQGLVSTIQKMKTADIAELSGRLSDWLRGETRKENAKKNPSEARLIGLQDRYDCLNCFLEDAMTVDEVLEKIQAIFTDERNGEGIRLSSIHKAKGLEANMVFFLEPKGATCPHPMAKSDWQRGQELNLRYVAITRAIETLVYVS